MTSMILRTGFECIKHSIQFTDGVLKKGEKLAFCHIKHVEEYVDGTVNNLITARCIRQTSITETPYKLEIEINKERHVIRVQCNCIAKKTGECKHIAALIHRINNDGSVSKTSVEQEWGFPSVNHLAKEQYSKGTSMHELFPQKMLKTAPPPFDFTIEHFADIESPIRKRLKICHMSEEERVCIVVMDISLLEREMEILDQCTMKIILRLLVVTSHSIMIEKAEITISSEKVYYYNHFIALSSDNIFELCLRTTQQNGTTEWIEARQIRITASKKAHQIKTMVRASSESLLVHFLNPKPLNIQSLNFGIQNEQKAQNCYKIEDDVHVFQIGLFLSPRQPWLGVSVDGVVVSDGMITILVEIKCPISCRCKLILDRETGKFNVGFIEVSSNGTVELKKTHVYYTQCQLQMYVTGMTICDVLVWSPRGSYTVEVHSDHDFLKMLIPKLENFYFYKYLPAPCNENKENELNI